jgi:signal transduction histidine kinase/CheY-like chemotaxis protein
LELVALGTQMQLQPNTTRAQFKVAFDRINTKVTGKCNECWQALSYAPFVPDAERAKFESAAQADLNDTSLYVRNTTRSLPNKNPTEPEYVPVFYIEPLDGNSGAVLFNLASSASRNYTITRARTTFKTQATPPITLVQEGENAGSSFGILVMHPFNFLPGLQSGKDRQQGIISGVIRLKTFVEQFLTSSGDHITISLVDVSEQSNFFTPPQFLHEIEADATGIIRSQSEGLSAADVEHEALKADLIYDGVLDCFSRKWRLRITGDYADYVNTSLRLNAIVFIIVFCATVFICIAVLVTIVKNFQKLLLSDTHISKLEVESEKLDAEKTAMERFLHMTSHDLRTPIQAIVNSTQLLSRGLKLSNSGDGYLSELVNICRSSCMMLDLIISNTMDSAKIQSGEQFDLVLETTYDLEGTVHDLMLTLDASTTGKKSVQIVRNIRLGGLGPVRCDSRKIMRVVLNMVSNAVKFTSSGDVVVHMFYKSRDDGKVDLHFAVSDSGRGMTPDEVVNACKPYVRAKSSQGGGTGLGLYICKSFVESCGGAMYIESTYGVGTVVSFTLPVQRLVVNKRDDRKLKGKKDDKGAKKAAGGDSTASKKPRRKDVVLVADESPLNVRLIKILLEKAGHTVLVANDGEEALIVLTDPQSNVGLAFLDLDLPKVPVLEVVHRFNSWEKKQGDTREATQLIALVTDTNDVSKIFGQQQSKTFVSTLYKPPTAADLAIAMRSVGGGEAQQGGSDEDLWSDSAASMHESDQSAHTRPEDVKLNSKFLLTEDAGDVAEADGSQPRVLVVDDNQVLLRLSVIMMRSFGYAVSSAGNGMEALHLMKGTRFDVGLFTPGCQIGYMDQTDTSSMVFLLQNNVKSANPTRGSFSWT